MSDSKSSSDGNVPNEEVRQIMASFEPSQVQRITISYLDERRKGAGFDERQAVVTEPAEIAEIYEAFATSSRGQRTWGDPNVATERGDAVRFVLKASRNRVGFTLVRDDLLKLWGARVEKIHAKYRRLAKPVPPEKPVELPPGL